MIDKVIVDLQSKRVRDWHNETPAVKSSSINFLIFVEEQHLQNFLLWHEEDKARNPKASDKEIADVKRNIDQLNGKRNQLIEVIDNYFINYCEKLSVKPWECLILNSETIGSIIDKLSILSLKIYHTDEQIQEKQGIRQKVKNKKEEYDLNSLIDKLSFNIKFLKIQQQNLQESLRKINNFEMGFKVYKQYKMYNDENLNPEIYNNK